MGRGVGVWGMQKIDGGGGGGEREGVRMTTCTCRWREGPTTCDGQSV